MAGEVLHVLGRHDDHGVERPLSHVLAETLLPHPAGIQIEQRFGTVHTSLPERPGV